MSFELRSVFSLHVRLILLFVLGLGIYGTAIAEEGIRWESDIRTAANIAHNSNRLVLIHFTADHCPPCKLMEKNVFPIKEVADSVHRTFVPVKIDTAANPEIVKDFQIKFIPADVVMAPDGRIVGIRNTEVEKNDLEGFMQFIHRRHFQDILLARNSMQQQNTAGLPDRNIQEAEANRFEHQPIRPIQEQSTIFEQSTGEQHNLETGFVIPPVFGQQVEENRVVTNPVQTEQAPSDVNEMQLPEPPAREFGQIFERPLIQEIEPPKTYTVAPQSSVGHAFTSENISGPQVQNNVNLASGQPYQRPTESSNFIADSFEGFDNENFNRPELLGLSIEGFCPVELTDNDRWIRGESRVCLLKDNLVFVFSSVEARETFLANPERYTPALSGCDLIEWQKSKTLVLGARKHGVRYREKTYLFASKENLDSFFKDPDKFIVK